MPAPTVQPLDARLVERFKNEGYVVLPGLFKDEAAAYVEHYMRLRAAGSYPGDMVGVDAKSDDPLKRFPRMINMHNWDELSLEWGIHERFRRGLTQLLGGEPYLMQTMIYFKPAGARGQALHQDQFYLRVQPGTCVAAWLALDDTDEANGCMQVVPGSHTLPVLCTNKADTELSFTDITVPVPEGLEVRPVPMQAGDVLVFNGQLIHGSYPNRSRDRFRRSLIAHYAVAEAKTATRHGSNVVRMDGSRLRLDPSADGGLCGRWVDKDGKPVVELVPTAS